MSQNQDPAGHRSSIGATMAVVAVMGFAFGDAITKLLVQSHAITTIVAVRYAVTLVILGGVVFWNGSWRSCWKTNRSRLVVFRALVLCTGSLCMGKAVTYIPVGEATSILYLAPIIVLAVAPRMLAEASHRLGWLAAAIGFAGVVLIIRPGSGLNGTGVAFAFVCLVMTVGYHLLTRILARSETAMSLQISVALIGGMICAPMALAAPSGVPLTLGAASLMLLLGVVMTIGHFIFTLAYRWSRATLIAPISYLQVFWAALFGGLMFSHLPDTISIIGMALVIGAGVLATLGERLSQRQNGARPQDP